MPQSLCTFSKKKFSECKHVQSLKIDKDVGIKLNLKKKLWKTGPVFWDK